jgi:hypothetical protein
VKAFEVNACTAREAGRRDPEHDEDSGNEEPYLIPRAIRRSPLPATRSTLRPARSSLSATRPSSTAHGAVRSTRGRRCSPSAGGRTPSGRARGTRTSTSCRCSPRPVRGRQVLVDALGRYEDQGVPLYNLACAEARLGETDAALEHLAAAVEQRPELRENARATTRTRRRSAATRVSRPSGRAASGGAAGRPPRRRTRGGTPPFRTRARTGGSAPRRWQRRTVRRRRRGRTRRDLRPESAPDQLLLADQDVEAGHARSDLNDFLPLRAVGGQVGLQHAGRRSSTTIR